MDMFTDKCLCSAATDGSMSLLDKLTSHSTGAPSGGDVHNDRLTQEDANNLALEMLYASQETLASAICNILIQLGTNKSVLRNLRRELLAGECCNHGKDLSYDRFQSLTCVNDVVREVLRTMPPVAGAFRKTQTDMQIGVAIYTAWWWWLVCSG